MEVKHGYKQTEVGVIPEEWEAKTFGDVITHCFSGATPRRNRPDYFKGNIRWITSGELNYNVITDTAEKLTSEAVARTNLKILPKGTFLMAITGLEAEGTRGSCGVVGEPSTTNQSCMAIFPTSELVAEYLFHYYVLRGKALALQYCQGTKQQSYTAKLVKQLPIVLPPNTDEQRAIAGALSDVDALIGVLDQLIAKKHDLKQAAMQQLLTGQKRLPGFSGEWEVKRLGDLASLSKGTQLHSNETDEDGRFAHLNGGITPSGYTHKSNTAGNTIAISEGGNSCGFVQFMTEPYWCGGHCYSVIPNGIDNQFLYHALKGQQSAIMALRVGSGLPNVQKTGLLAFKLRVPADRPEQTAIAEVLSDMDAELAALEQRLVKTRALKQGMMQELLTGRTRLV